MGKKASTTNAQKHFLCALHKNTKGPTADQWPSPAILRRWLRKPGFRRALETVMEALRFQADFNLATAATAASQALGDPVESEKQIGRLSALMRLSHVRQRFAAEKEVGQGGDEEEREEAEEEDDSDDSEDSECPEDEDEIPEHVRRIPPQDRLTFDEFHELAVGTYYYSPGVLNYEEGGFPLPPPEGSVYHDILANPRVLLAFLSRVNQTDPQKRYGFILEKCKDYVCCDAWLPKFAAGDGGGSGGR